MNASSQGNLDVVKVLLDNGAEINAENNGGKFMHIFSSEATL